MPAKIRDIAEIRILPPFAIGRLGSSPDPMDNYELLIEDPVGPRKIVPARTLLVEDSGELRARESPFDVRFRDQQGRIRPVAPFLEVWARFVGESELFPLEIGSSEPGISPSDVSWQVQVGNNKAYRHTSEIDDRVLADTGLFSDHDRRELQGRCKNFFKDKYIPFGHVQYIKPNDAFPQIRLRFTPAAGKVYGPPSTFGHPDKNLAEVVYEPKPGKNSWEGWVDPHSSDLASRRTTNPGYVYAGWMDDKFNQYSWAYFDDECDGIVEVDVNIRGKKFNAYARITAGPPSFAPDSMPVRTIADELEQAMCGPEFDGPATEREFDEAKQIVRRALETVRLMNTAQMNAASTQPGVGMARMDYLDVLRALEPIFEPALADSLAIQARHERVLLALESGSLVWFARILRGYDEIGDLSTEARRKMPALMRGPEGNHLALTRRQVAKIRAVADMTMTGLPSANVAAPASPSRPAIQARNLTAQLNFDGVGNPPTAHPRAAVSNCFPGLETDFRNAWRRILVEIELHEGTNFVMSVDPSAPENLQILANGYQLLKIEDTPVTVPVTGPKIKGGPNVPLPDTQFNEPTIPLEWSNALAAVLHHHAGQPVSCTFQCIEDGKTIERSLTMRRFFDEEAIGGETVKRAVISRDLVPPGYLTQSLCSPWQADYRQCSCFYWAATRPDYVNIEPRPDGTSDGNNWLQKNRTPETPRVYVVDDHVDTRLVSASDLYRQWEKALRFIIGGEDVEPE
ncbi:MAG TPA: hypothetical protein VE178_19935 [Silvibacterium sp.]|nr:hypothetical protein [Silvibacterium sp.]